MSDLDELAKASARPTTTYRRPVVHAPGVPMAVIWGGIIALLMILGAVGAVIQGRRRPAPPPQATPQQLAEAAKNRQAAAGIRATLDRAVSDGVIHSIDWDRGTMRVEPLVWAGEVVEEKQKLTTLFYNYYDLQGRPRTVKILSNRNDTVFAEADIWNGVQVHH